MSDIKVDFGFKKVERNQKQGLVQKVFSDVADKYDVMNDAMSLGLHRLWKNELVKSELCPQSDQVLIDVAGGTGDIANLFIKEGGAHAAIVDLNKEMLEAGKVKLNSKQLDWVHANAEELPFEGETFDFYTISFGIRNVTNIDKLLQEAYRVLKPCGKFVCMEFSSEITPIMKPIYKAYLMKILPLMGKIIADNADAYEYLAQSIIRFLKPTQLLHKMERAGFIECSYRKLNLGVVCIHIGYK